MKRKNILLLFVLVLIFMSGCSPAQGKGYIIKEASSKNWKFTGGELLFKGEKQELKYSIGYIGSEEFQPVGLTFEFFICPNNKDTKCDINSAEHLHSNINGYLDKKVDKDFTRKDSFQGRMLDSKKEYNYENLYLKISYEVNGKKFEEVIKLPMEKM